MSSNGDTPATKADLAKLRQELLDAVGAQRGDLLEAIHDSETRLLRAFYSYAESAGKHFTDLDTSDIVMRQRLATLEDRLLAVEKRLNMPPAS